MTYRRYIIGLGICACLFTGCEQEIVFTEEEVIQESVTETRTSEQASAPEESDTSVTINLEDVTAEQLKQVTMSIETIQQESDWETMEKMEFIVLDSVEDDVVLYGRGTGEGMILRIKDEVYPIMEGWLSPRIVIPELYVQDIDKDGETEYIIKTHVKTGTGVSGDDLYVITYEDGTFTMHKFMEDDWYKQLMSQLSWKYDEEYDTVEVYVDGTFSGATLCLTKFLEENQVTFQDLCFGDIMEFVCRDEQWYLRVQGGILVEDWVTPQYECGIDILAPFSYAADGTFTLGEMQVTARNEYEEE